MENKKNMGLVWSIIICVVVVAALVFISFNKTNNMTSNNDNSMNDSMINPAPTNSVPVNPNPVAATPTPTSGEVAKAGDTVSVNYTGRLENGTVFDSNVDPKFGHVQPFIFTLGAGQVIKGWDTGIVGMKVGEKKTLTIPPEDAYGAAGQGPIPPNSTLIFDVQLLAIK